MGTPSTELTLTDTQRAMLRTLVYFDIFRHPLREDELLRFLSMACPDRHCVNDALALLIAERLLVRSGEFYALNNATEAVQQRLAGEERASRRMRKAQRMSRLMGAFPFVRGVLLSGSMSKGVLAEDGDIDYFVITAPGRLWLARTLLIAFKKVFLLNSRRHFCVNYFVDTEHLGIEDRNLFTATEVMTLVPMHGRSICAAFFEANAWAAEHLPNAAKPNLDQLRDEHGRLTLAWETILSGGFGDELDAWCMMRTKERWRRKFPEFDSARFELALRSRRYVSKHHPRNFQENVLKAFEQGLTTFEQRTGIAVS
jgi:hypothetical protein